MWTQTQAGERRGAGRYDHAVEYSRTSPACWLASSVCSRRDMAPPTYSCPQLGQIRTSVLTYINYDPFLLKRVVYYALICHLNS